MTVAVTAFSASAVVGLLVAPASPWFAWATRACLVALVGSALLAAASVGLMLAGLWTLPVLMLTLAIAVLVPACWLARTPGPPSGADADPDDESGGGGGGGLRKPPPEPPPAPPSPGLDWDAFDRARESWDVREPALR